MRIGIDMRAFVRRSTGIPRVLREIVNELAKIDGTNTYYLYVDRDFDSPFPEARWYKRFQNRFPLLPGTVWLCTDARRMIAEDGLDLFWGPGGVLPPKLPPTVVRIVTIHDMVWKKYPSTMSRFARLTNHLLVERSIRDASVLVAVSKSTAAEIQGLLGVPGSKIHIVYNGIGGEFQPHPHNTSARYIAQKYGVSEEYILAVGTVEPRKNLATLMKAIQILWQRPASPPQLVIAGARGWKNSPIYGSLERLELTHSEVVFAGYIEEGDLPKAYSGAKVFAMPSLYEGFGLPLLEAMACGVPVVSSDAAALVEVAGGAGVTVPAQRADLMAEAIARVIDDGELRRSMIEKGRVQAQQFSWQRSARQMLEVFEEACAARSS